MHSDINVYKKTPDINPCPIVSRYKITHHLSECILVSMYPDINVYSTYLTIKPHIMYLDIITNTKYSAINTSRTPCIHKSHSHTMHSNINVII